MAMTRPKATWRSGSNPPTHACPQCRLGSVVIACAICGSELHEQYPEEAWLEVELEGGWIAAYRLISQEGQPVVGEVRVFPNENAPRRAGRWSAERLGSQAPVPFGGVPARILRQLRVREHLSLLHDIAEAHQQFQSFRINLLDHGFERVAREAGRRGRSDRFYAEIASAYVQLVSERNPIQQLREQLEHEQGLHFAEATIRDFVNQARSRDLLTRSPKGRPGGELTPKALDLLRGAAVDKQAHQSKRWLRMRNPGDGSVGEATQLAFERVWEPKGWTLVEDDDGEGDNEGEQA